MSTPANTTSPLGMEWGGGVEVREGVRLSPPSSRRPRRAAAASAMSFPAAFLCRWCAVAFLLLGKPFRRAPCIPERGTCHDCNHCGTDLACCRR